MIITRHIGPGSADRDGCVMTIGNFDGLHLGHQSVFRQLNRISRERNSTSLVMTFEPHPLEFFSPDSAPDRITSIREKIILLQQTGIERLACLRFDSKLADLSAREFTRHILVDGLNARAIIVGDDFRFGRGRTGDFDTLQQLGREWGFDVFATDTCSIDNERVSSSRIRDALKKGKLDVAEKLLGRPYFISGRVVHGDKRGRELGFPTANISLRSHKPPLVGIYAVRVSGIQDAPMPAIAYLGSRPMFDGNRLILEVYIFDDPGDIYGRRISVEFFKHIRFDMTFSSVTGLQQQIRDDVARARQLFADYSN